MNQVSEFYLGHAIRGKKALDARTRQLISLKSMQGFSCHLSRTGQDLIERQLAIMKLYSNVLEERINGKQLHAS